MQRRAGRLRNLVAQSRCKSETPAEAWKYHGIGAQEPEPLSQQQWGQHTGRASVSRVREHRHIKEFPDQLMENRHTHQGRRDEHGPHAFILHNLNERPKVCRRSDQARGVNASPPGFLRNARHRPLARPYALQEGEYA